MMAEILGKYMEPVKGKRWLYAYHADLVAGNLGYANGMWVVV